MALIIYFLRHGQTAFSRDNAFCGSGVDPDLTPVGLEMARSFADAYRFVSWNAIYSSPLKRAAATAEALCGIINVKPELRDDLKEIGYGKWEGMTVEAVSRDYHDDYVKWSADPAWNAPTNGEPAVGLARRGLKVVEEIRRFYADGNVLVVSHKATIRAVLCGLLGIDVGRFRSRLSCPVASVSVVEFGSQGPLLKTLADTSHFDERLKNQPGT